MASGNGGVVGLESPDQNMDEDDGSDYTPSVAAPDVVDPRPRYRLTGPQAPENYFLPPQARKSEVVVSSEPLELPDVPMDGGEDVMEDVASDQLKVMVHEGYLQWIRYHDVHREEVVVCGTKVWQSVPAFVKDEISGETLDPTKTMTGFRREYDHMTSKNIGRLISQSQAKDLAYEYGIKILGTRWVITRKIRNGVEEVRCRCVVQDVRDGVSATMYGFSSPTASVEAMKIVLAMAGLYDMALIGADVATAYMSAPLPQGVKSIIRLPAGTYYSSGDSVYCLLTNAINGLRPASLAWVLFFSKLVRKVLSLQPSEVDPTLFAGFYNSNYVIIVTYVDDLLILGPNLKICQEMLSKLAATIDIRQTGAIGNTSEHGGCLTFLGRKIVRDSSSSRLTVIMEQSFNDGLISAGAGLRPCDVLPDMKHYLEGQMMLRMKS